MNLLTWEGYADDSFVKPFEEDTGCSVDAVYVGSNDEFFAKLMGGGGAYDLISPSNDTTMKLIDAGLVDPVDMSKVPASKEFFETFESPAWLSKDGKTYGVPYAWGIIRIIVDADAVDGTPDSLAFLWDPKFKGKLAMWDDIETVYTAARYLGIEDIYDMDDEQLAKVKEALLELKPNIRKYWFTTSEMGTLMQGKEVVGGNSWEETLLKLKEDGRDIIDVDPKEGRGGWSDSWMIAKGASENECVYKWLDYVSTAKVQALGHKVTGFGYANKNLVGELTPEEKESFETLGMSDPETLKTVSWWQPVKQRAKYLEIWNQVKAAQ
ncbi:ABC transporter substrate-binding protein [Methyloligella sp. 2.7D]|uniref:ABC transporter substrate-binding protein n=1 Tax=unclassified Methyloligella TaxID=2625955 RepID=UPI00157D3BE6|nr:ABC transporter substrate-binding protein [Methyloligella sp. GL2]QKP78097.1 ABC transporter substrate-binding protein [Methyloligella sp. GL2]